MVDVAENEVRGLASDAGETRQLLHRAGDPAAVLFKENFRALDEVFGLGIVKAAGLDGFADLFIAGVGERLERREPCVQRGGDHVHARIGALGGEPHGEKQLIILLVLQRAQGVGVERLQRLNDTADSGFGFHGVTSRIILAKSIPHISQKIDRKSVGKREKICYDKSTGEMEVPPCAYSSSSAFFHGSTAMTFMTITVRRSSRSRASSHGAIAYISSTPPASTSARCSSVC